MGFYIETELRFGKAVQICGQVESAEVIIEPLTFQLPAGKTLVCVVENPLFEAAGVCYDAREFEDFSDPTDPRYKTWVLMDLEDAARLCPDYAAWVAREALARPLGWGLRSRWLGRRSSRSFVSCVISRTRWRLGREAFQEAMDVVARITGAERR